MECMKTKTIMTKSNQGNRWFGIDYHMNLYRGCSYNCIYCDSRADAYHIIDFDSIQTKENALKILEEELASKQVKGVVSFGTLSDPYNELEKKLQLTRGALELIKKYGFGVSIDTKSDLILRDIDLLKEIQEHNNVIIKISISTYMDDLAKKIEPKVISSTKRFSVVKQLIDNGIYTGVLLMPVLPFITDSIDNIKTCVAKANEYQAKFIYTKLGMTLRKKAREYYYSYLDKLYPGLSKDYETVYGKNLVCNPLNYRELLEVFINECNKYHILCDMSEIIEDYKKPIPTRSQIQFF